ncbi:MAG: FHA domain-containing protein [Planctomycetota bacterium]|nr:MAG: FHA domain-containing protein [Planctomycetota bacterium]
MVEGGAVGGAHRLRSGRSLLLGSWHGADVRVEGPGVRERHARLLSASPTSWAVFSVGDAPLRVNGRPCKRAALREGDRLEVGGASLRMARAEDCLVVVQGLNQGETFEITRGVTLGRSVSADVTLYDIRCSREHCRVDTNAGGFSAVDLGSTNGTYLNEVRLVPGVPRPLLCGDRLRLGDTVLELRAAPPAHLPRQDAALARLAGAAVSERRTESLSRDALDGADLRGDLGRMAFSQVVQLLSYAGKTGELALDTPAGQGLVRFRRGRVDDAQLPGWEPGEPSFFALARQRGGSFAFRQDDAAPAPGGTRRIERGTLSLLLEAARRSDEA